MSIPAEKQRRDFQRFAWPARIAPLAVAGILAALWLSEAPDPAIGFSLSGPSVVAPGTKVALRAWHLTDHGVDAPPTVIELKDGSGALISTTTMTTSLAEGLEGEVSLPDDIEGTAFFVARTDIDENEVSLTYSVSVEPEDALRAYQPGRETSPFQVYELGPLRVVDAEAAPEELDPRIEGGACIPELPCWLSVWVGEKAARVRVHSIAGVRFEETLIGPTQGFLRFPLVVAGNEARIEVQALGPDDQVVASREVRLPVVPGGISARASVEGRRVRIEWDELGGSGPVLVDAYRGNHWTYAFSVTPDEPWLPLPLDPGVWRLQVRADLFSRNTAGVTHVVIPEAGGSAVLQVAAQAVLADAQREGLDPIAMAVVDGEVPSDQTEDAIRALFGPRNFGVVSLAGVVSRVEMDPGQRRRELMRWIAAAIILAIGLLVSLALLRLELLAQARARELLE
ncbi:MAG: hypothetical protein O7F08_13080, partial [Deltaproteobacteria bacterium]|nr:hypothetical protein [Deltaproteobacteria bacterium]